MLEGLRAFAKLTDGKYPSTLAGLTVSQEFYKAYAAKYGRQTQQSEEKQKLQSLQQALVVVSFYANLLREEKKPVYYGNRVGPEDVDTVLMRWKISDDKYRVIYGDLTTENVSAEQLAELEAEQSE